MLYFFLYFHVRTNWQEGFASRDTRSMYGYCIDSQGLFSPVCGFLLRLAQSFQKNLLRPLPQLLRGGVRRQAEHEVGRFDGTLAFLPLLGGEAGACACNPVDGRTTLRCRSFAFATGRPVELSVRIRSASAE